MKKLLLLPLLLAGCSTVPVTVKFPDAPTVLMEKCPPLKTIDQEEVSIIDLTKNVTILTNGNADFTSEQIDKLAKHNIEIIETEISEIEHKDGQLNNIIFKDGSKMPFAVAYGAIPFTQQSNIPVSLGCELTDLGYIKIVAFQKTTVPNIYVCGDNSNMMRSVANAVSSGSIAGAVANGELVQEQF